jgi:DNA-binding beta-propeller fold protein YncE
MMPTLAWTIVSLCFLAPGWEAPTPRDASGYHLLKRIPLGGEGGWDYLTADGTARRLYITRGNRVTVMDMDKGDVVGEVTGLAGIHGVALVPERNRGFVSNGGDGTVVVFDLKTFKEVNRVKVGQRPDAIVYDGASGRVFSMNAGSKDTTAVDAEGEKAVGSVALGGKPEFAASDGKGMLYINIEDKNEIVGVDTKELKVVQRWPIAPGTEPAGLAMDRHHRRLFSTCHNQMMVVVDADSGKVVATPAIGRGTDACAFDDGERLAFSSNGDGTLTVIRADGSDKYDVVANVRTEQGARTMAVDTTNHQVYLCTAKVKAAPAGASGGGRRRSYEPGSFVILVVGK